MVPAISPTVSENFEPKAAPCKGTCKSCCKGPILSISDFSDPESYPVRYVNAMAHTLGASVVFEYLPDPVACLPDRAAGNLEQKSPSGIEFSYAARVYDDLQFDELLQPLTAVAKKYRPQLMVIGTNSELAEARGLLASFARRVAYSTEVPVLLVGPPDEAALKMAGHWQTVLAATDFAPPSTEGLLRAHELAGRHLIALHCVTNAEKRDAHRFLGQLRMLAPFNESHTVPVEHFIPTGNPAEQIVAFANKAHPDLIVLGSPVSSREKTADAESVVCSIVKEVRCPVLLMPQHKSEQGKTVFLSELVS